MKKIAILPTLLTLGNAVCGFASIAYASKVSPNQTNDPNFAVSGWFIVAAMVFDALDGYVARLSKSASDFGGQLDSLCDAVSFGAAPAFLLLRLGPSWDRPQLHQALVIIATLYMVCALLRLARFNVDNTPDPASHKRFRGLPSPGAAGCLASLGILCGELPGSLAILDRNFVQQWSVFKPENVRLGVEVVAPLGGLVVALLMVSRVPYPHLTKQILRGRRPFRHLMQIILTAFIIMLIRELALALLFWGYALFFVGRYAWWRVTRRAELPAAEDEPPPRREPRKWPPDVQRTG